MKLVIRNPITRCIIWNNEEYAIANGFGIFPVRNKRELKALVEFCTRYIAENKDNFLLTKRLNIFQDFLDFYKAEYESDDDKEFLQLVEKTGFDGCYHYCQGNAGWFWD